MILTLLHVKNFRSILDQALACERLTAIVGPNGSGKSSFLKAIDLFYASVPQFNELDFYDEKTAEPIEIGATFSQLTPAERDRFGKYVEGDSLTVVRVLPGTGGRNAKYHGSSLQNLECKAVREAGGANEVKRAFKALTEKPEYADLSPAPRTQLGVLEELGRWEFAHPERCRRLLDDGQFFGFTEVAQGYLGASTRFIFIPAVRDAANDAEEGKDSAITQLMDLLVRNVIATRPEINAFQQDMRTQYSDLMEPAVSAELRSLSQRLTETLSAFVRDAGVDVG